MDKVQTLVKRPIEVSNRYHLLACDPTEAQVSSRDVNGGATSASTIAPALLSDHQQGPHLEKNTADSNKIPEKLDRKTNDKIGGMETYAADHEDNHAKMGGPR